MWGVAVPDLTGSSSGPGCGFRFWCLVLELAPLFLTTPVKPLSVHPYHHFVIASDFPDCAEEVFELALGE